MAVEYYGVDIGTQNTRVSASLNGEARVIYNQIGEKNTPTCVSFSENLRILGSIAEQKLVENPQSTFNCFTQLLAKRCDHMIVEREKSLSMFPIIAAENNEAAVNIIYEGEKGVYLPEQLLSMHMQTLNEITEFNLEKGGCLSVPDFYLEREKKAVKDAVRIAGFKDMQVVRQIDAVCTYYAKFNAFLPEKDRRRTVAFVDLGHTHLSVSICSVNKQAARILAIVCDPCIGGRDLDFVLYNEMKRRIEESVDAQVLSAPRAQARLLKSCVKLKYCLTTNEDAMTLETQYFTNDNDFTSEMDRRCFENLSRSLIDPIKATLKKAIEISGVDKNDIDCVELAGAGSRVPSIRRVVGLIFGADKHMGILPEEATAIGCALMADTAGTSSLEIKDPDCGKKTMIRSFTGENKGKYIRFLPASRCNCEECKSGTGLLDSYAEVIGEYLNEDLSEEALSSYKDVEDQMSKKEKKTNQFKLDGYNISKEILNMKSTTDAMRKETIDFEKQWQEMKEVSTDDMQKFTQNIKSFALDSTAREKMDLNTVKYNIYLSPVKEKIAEENLNAQRIIDEMSTVYSHCSDKSTLKKMKKILDIGDFEEITVSLGKIIQMAHQRSVWIYADMFLCSRANILHNTSELLLKHYGKINNSTTKISKDELSAIIDEVNSIKLDMEPTEQIFKCPKQINPEELDQKKDLRIEESVKIFIECNQNKDWFSKLRLTLKDCIYHLQMNISDIYKSITKSFDANHADQLTAIQKFLHEYIFTLSETTENIKKISKQLISIEILETSDMFEKLQEVLTKEINSMTKNLKEYLAHKNGTQFLQLRNAIFRSGSPSQNIVGHGKYAPKDMYDTGSPSQNIFGHGKYAPKDMYDTGSLSRNIFGHGKYAPKDMYDTEVEHSEILEDGRSTFQNGYKVLKEGIDRKKETEICLNLVALTLKLHQLQEKNISENDLLRFLESTKSTLTTKLDGLGIDFNEKSLLSSNF